MARSNARGTYGERDAAAKLPNGRVVSERGKEGHDVEADPMALFDATRFEVKLVKELPKWLVGWQEQAVREDAILMFRQNRGEWWLAAPLGRWSPQSGVTLSASRTVRVVGNFEIVETDEVLEVADPLG